MMKWLSSHPSPADEKTGEAPVKIQIQTEDFSVADEYQRLRGENPGCGAIVTFTGLVRELDHARQVSSLYLEHYPGMTESSLREIAANAGERWPILDLTIIHRVGELKAGDQIVLVAVSSEHRHAAFNAADFIMDYLKTRAPFWKKCRDDQGEYWVEARSSDEEALGRW